MSSIASLRKNIGLVVLFGFLTITFLILAVGEFTGSLGYVCLILPSNEWAISYYAWQNY